MEGAVTGMEALITTVGTVLSGFVTWFGQISAMLIDSEIIGLMIGLAVAILLVNIMIKIIGKATFRRSGRRR